MLLGIKLLELQHLHIVQIGQLVGRLFFFVLLLFLNLVNLQEAVETHHRSAHAEIVSLAGLRGKCAAIFAVVTSKTAGTICDATNRFQMSV